MELACWVGEHLAPPAGLLIISDVDSTYTYVSRFAGNKTSCFMHVLLEISKFLETFGLAIGVLKFMPTTVRSYV